MKYTPLFLDKIKKGDQESFEKLYNDLFPSLVLFAKKYVDDDNLSEDIVQEIFMKFWNNVSSINIRISIKSYLYMAVRNNAINYLNQKAILTEKLNKHISYEMTSSDEYKILSQDVYHQVHNAIKSLPQKSQEVIRMSMNELSIAEIQEELNLSKNTIKTHKRRAYAMLREKLKSIF
ncbi:MAG: RNA polymerase sigma-70 factor [Bacteroidales bacterium]|nr:RNA polymerase sigma-70 factor [Bacteroidales bacterium]